MISKRMHLYFLLIMMISSCLRSPTEPDLVTSKELAKIPFEDLSGKIFFKRTLNDQAERCHFMILNAQERTLRSIAIFDTYVPTNLMTSRNGEKILFSYYVFKGQTRSFLWQMYVMDVASKVVNNIAPSIFDDSFGAWSPDSDKIAFWSNRFLRSSIWIADLAQDSVYHLKDVSEPARTRPAWFSHEPAILIGDINENSFPAFYRIDLPSGAIEEIYRDNQTSADVIFKHPMISHDDKNLAFVKSYKDKFDEIWLFNFGSSKAEQITTGYFDWHPAWSPDDTKILFSRGDFLSVVKIEDREIKQITRGKHIDEFPSWTQ